MLDPRPPYQPKTLDEIRQLLRNALREDQRGGLENRVNCVALAVLDLIRHLEQWEK